MGPTASGKSALSLALAQRFPMEIVSVDSAQIYRGMDVGTAKPDAATRRRVPHHLIDIVDPTDAYSAARFCADALAAVDAIRGRGRIPLLAGGTMLYFKALTEGLSALPGRDPAVRAGLDARAAARRLAGAARRARPRRSGDGGAPRPDGCATDPARARGACDQRNAALGASRRARGKRDARPRRAHRARPGGSRAPPRVDRGPVRRDARGGARRRTAGAARSAFRSPLRCRRCAASAIARPGNTWMAASISRSSAQWESPPRAQLAKRQMTWLRSTSRASFDPWDPNLAEAVAAPIIEALDKA